MPLANLTLGTAAATVTFSSISAGYRDLVLVVTGLNNATTGNATLRFNGDTASNYTTCVMEASGGLINNNSQTTSYIIGGNNYSGLTQTNISTIMFHIMDFATTDKQKTVLTRSSNGGSAVILTGGRWANTAAITSVQVLTSNSTTYTAGSTFALYGVTS